MPSPLKSNIRHRPAPPGLLTLLLFVTCHLFPVDVLSALTPSFLTSHAEPESDESANAALLYGDRLLLKQTVRSQKDALSAYNTALTKARKSGNLSQSALVYLRIGAVCENLGDLKAAKDAYQRARAALATVPPSRLTADVLNAEASLLLLLRELSLSRNLAEQARSLSISLGYREGEGRALTSLGAIASNMHEPDSAQRARSYFQSALPIWSETSYPKEQAVTFSYFAYMLARQGDEQGSIGMLQRAHALYKSAGSRRGEAEALQDLGNCYARLGSLGAAFEHYSEALELFTLLGDSYGKAIVLDDMAFYRQLAGYPDVLDLYKQALRSAYTSRDPLLTTVVLGDLSHEFAVDHQGHQALQYALQEYDLVLRSGNGDPISVARALRNIGQAYLVLRQISRALPYFRKASAPDLLQGDTGDKADALLDTALALEQSHELPAASEFLRNAASVGESSGRRRTEAEARYHLAGILANAGSLEEARTEIDKALNISEKLRQEAGTEDTKALWFATVHEYYERSVEILMRSHTRDTAGRYNELAFQVSERSRARSLNDMLRAAQVPETTGVEAQVTDRQSALKRSLADLSEQQLKLLETSHSSKLELGLATRLQSLQASDAALHEKIAAESPLFGSGQGRPLDIASAQALLSEDEIVLEYFLGQKASYLWVITQHSFESSRLSGAANLETLIRAYRQALIERPGGTVDGGASKMGAIRKEELLRTSARLQTALLAPVAQKLGQRRLIIVGEGSLQYIPFASLSVPATGHARLQDARFLGADHEIVYLPSLSALSILRSRKHTSKAAKEIAIFADPVFEQDDPRITRNQPGSVAQANKHANADVTAATRDVSSSGQLPRLPGTRQEASAIAALFKPAQTKVALDFNASIHAATGTDISDYRIIHFATHSLMDSKRPERSGIVLSLFDKAGKHQDGYLRLKNVYGLRLSADLVVLSACDTALGKQVRGEGMLGMVRGFMYAGVPATIATLWKVDDDTTKEFMSVFYRNLTQKHERPIDALHEAQVTMSETGSKRAPYYWAAFVLEGDWR